MRIPITAEQSAQPVTKAQAKPAPTAPALLPAWALELIALKIQIAFRKSVIAYTTSVGTAWKGMPATLVKRIAHQNFTVQTKIRGIGVSLDHNHAT